MISTRRTLLAGLGLILAVNAVALGGVAYNRSGEPDSVLRLTQRELGSPYGWRRGSENSGLGLVLNWRVLPRESGGSVRPYISYGGMGGSPEWLDEAKLRELGFSFSSQAPQDWEYRRRDWLQEREVLLVLELDGPAYRQALERVRQYAQREEALLTANTGNKEFEQRAKAAKDELQREENSNSRLFVVDAGLDATVLRGRYPDRGRHVIVPGLVHPAFASRGKPVQGHVSRLSIGELHVPVEFHAAFTHSGPNYPGGIYQGSYEAEVAFGKRHEPWIRSASGKAGGE